MVLARGTRAAVEQRHQGGRGGGDRNQRAALPLLGVRDGRGGAAVGAVSGGARASREPPGRGRVGGGFGRGGFAGAVEGVGAAGEEVWGGLCGGGEGCHGGGFCVGGCGVVEEGGFLSERGVGGLGRVEGNGWVMCIV